MNAPFPLAPLDGFSEIAYLMISLGLGVLFGFFLERAGFGTSKNLTSVFILRDFRVFRVMFTAVVTAMLGALILDGVGILNLSLVQYEATFFWPILLGGLVFGVGFYVGGFCPGTAVVALARGRWDAPAFLFGIVLGIYAFALLFDGLFEQAWFINFFAPADAAKMTLYGDGPAWPWALGVVLMALGGFAAVPYLERRFALKTVAELKAEKSDSSTPAKPVVKAPRNFWNTAAPALAFVGVVVVIVTESATPHPVLANHVPKSAATALDPAEAPLVDSYTLAGWLVAEGNNRQAGKPKDLALFDLRPVNADKRDLVLPLSVYLEAGDSDGDAFLAEALIRLGKLTADLPKSKPLVFVDDSGQTSLALVNALRRRGKNALALDGGLNAWRRDILSDPSTWPLPSFMPKPATAFTQTALAYLGGQSQTPPPRFVFAGATPPETKIVTVKAKGAGGGGCN